MWPGHSRLRVRPACVCVLGGLGNFCVRGSTPGIWFLGSTLRCQVLHLPEGL